MDFCDVSGKSKGEDCSNGTGSADGQGGGGAGSQCINSTGCLNAVGGAGGVGLQGEGASGSGHLSYGATHAAMPGSGGEYKQYGGGGQGVEDDSTGYSATGGHGAVRIIWGAGRQFPSTNTADI